VSKENANVLGRGFDRITSVYDVMACICSFNRINKSQLAFLSQLSTQKTGLILGGGTGFFLQKVLEENQEIEITYVDASSKMIEFARKRIEKNLPHDLNRVNFICKGVEDLEWQTFDLIVCNYLLDLFDNLYVKVLTQKFKLHLKPNGLLYVTDFHVSETNSFLKWSTQIGLKVLYTFFRWTTNLQTKELPNTDRLLKEESFQVIDSKDFLGGILRCSLYNVNG
jgi:ubiquinone/menaquinone biosynthesis C-methylase UbiE